MCSLDRGRNLSKGWSNVLTLIWIKLRLLDQRFTNIDWPWTTFPIRMNFPERKCDEEISAADWEVSELSRKKQGLAASLLRAKRHNVTAIPQRVLSRSKAIVQEKSVQDKHSSAPRQMADQGWRGIHLLLVGRSYLQKYFLEPVNLPSNGRMMRMDINESLTKLKKMGRKINVHVQSLRMRWGSRGLAFHLCWCPSSCHAIEPRPVILRSNRVVRMGMATKPRLVVLGPWQINYERSASKTRRPHFTIKVTIRQLCPPVLSYSFYLPQKQRFCSCQMRWMLYKHKNANESIFKRSSFCVLGVGIDERMLRESQWCGNLGREKVFALRIEQNSLSYHTEHKYPQAMWRTNNRGLATYGRRGEWRIVRLWEQGELQSVNGRVEAKNNSEIQQWPTYVFWKGLKAFSTSGASILPSSIRIYVRVPASFSLRPALRGAVDTSVFLTQRGEHHQRSNSSTKYHFPTRWPWVQHFDNPLLITIQTSEAGHNDHRHQAAYASKDTIHQYDPRPFFSSLFHSPSILKQAKWQQGRFSGLPGALFFRLWNH